MRPLGRQTPKDGEARGRLGTLRVGTRYPQWDLSVASKLSSIKSSSEVFFQGHVGGSVAEHLPLAQSVIPGPGIESHIRLPAGSLLLPLPMSLPLSVCVSHE
ncbi:hypothetical protein VULLAG_LOCUS22521 [Vulpes lagopus]